VPEFAAGVAQTRFDLADDGDRSGPPGGDIVIAHAGVGLVALESTIERGFEPAGFAPAGSILVVGAN
jgi:hypothetical protein